MMEQEEGQPFASTAALVAMSYYELLGGIEPDYDSDTTKRVYKFAEELKAKRTYNKFTTFAAVSDDMIIGNHLRLFSICEHHLLPFFGEVAIGYIPDKKIFGLSKFQRLVDQVASMPQLQERLTHDIMTRLTLLLEPAGACVVVKAIHTCVFARGVQSSGAEFTTSAVSGVFKTEPAAKAEFFNSIENNRLRL